MRKTKPISSLKSSSMSQTIGENANATNKDTGQCALAPIVVKDHRLYDQTGDRVVHCLSPNHGELISPSYLIMHYTAGSSLESTVDWFKTPRSRASAHVVIGVDGKIAQLVPFNLAAWHAGTSRWIDLVGLNDYSIGIELDNPGPLQKKENGKWQAWFGREYDDDVVVWLKHKREQSFRGWHVFGVAQLAAAKNVAIAICNHYRIRDLLGHDDIAPDRKRDPGPAFPMASFRSAVLGRKEDFPALA
ncbi:MAG: N-acetylmuramoyl-L-alanine amidase [bacterium]